LSRLSFKVFVVGGTPPTTILYRKAGVNCCFRLEDMFVVYVIRSLKTGKYYIGSTKDLEVRIGQHNANKTRSLKNKGPFFVVYTETFGTRTEARKREILIKSFKGGEAFRKLLNISGAVV
jgi:putative endonuclease